MNNVITPHEKARQLFNKYRLVNAEAVELESGESDVIFSLSDNDSKKCALIAVEDIINMASRAMNVYIYSEDGTQILHQYPEAVYWWWVKQELEKL